MPKEDYERLTRLFSKRLKELMEGNNINQVELSAAMGLSRSTVNKWITQKALPRMEIIEKLALFFGVSKSYLLEEEKTDKRKSFVNPERRIQKVTIAMAAKLMNKGPQFVRVALQRGLVPFGFAVKLSENDNGRYDYYINPTQFCKYLGITEEELTATAKELERELTRNMV